MSEELSPEAMESNSFIPLGGPARDIPMPRSITVDSVPSGQKVNLFIQLSFSHPNPSVLLVPILLSRHDRNKWEVLCGIARTSLQYSPSTTINNLQCNHKGKGILQTTEDREEVLNIAHYFIPRWWQIVAVTHYYCQEGTMTKDRRDPGRTSFANTSPALASHSTTGRSELTSAANLRLEIADTQASAATQTLDVLRRAVEAAKAQV